MHSIYRFISRYLRNPFKHKLQLAASPTQRYLDHRDRLLVASFSLAASSGSCPGRCPHTDTQTHTHSHTQTSAQTIFKFVISCLLDNCLNLRLFLHSFPLFLIFFFIVNLRTKLKPNIYESISIIYRMCEMLCVFSTFISSVCLILVAFIYSTHFDGIFILDLKQINENF